MRGMMLLCSRLDCSHCQLLLTRKSHIYIHTHECKVGTECICIKNGRKKRELSHEWVLLGLHTFSSHLSFDRIISFCQRKKKIHYTNKSSYLLLAEISLFRRSAKRFFSLPAQPFTHGERLINFSPHKFKIRMHKTEERKRTAIA